MEDHTPSSQHVPLPPLIEEFVDKICKDQNQPPLGTMSRRRLASLTEEQALNILHVISGQEIRSSFGGFVMHLARQYDNNNTDNGLPSSSSSSFSYSSPSKRPYLQMSPQQQQRKNRISITPTHHSPTQSDFRVQSPIPFRMENYSMSSLGGAGSTISPQLVALGELEFRKAFLILSYIGGRTLEEVLSAHRIRELKDLPMSMFESEIWKAFGCSCDYIKEQQRVKYLDWDSRKTSVYHCHVYPDGSYRFKGPYLSKPRNLLQRTFGDDNILMVKFAEEVTDERNLASSSCDYYFDKYSRILREGILVGLRRYRFFVFKDGGKEEKKKDQTSSQVKCFFVRMESAASVDDNEYILCGKTIRDARSVFMHVDGLSNLSNYMARLSLILSKTINLDIDLSCVNIETIADEPCRDKDGNSIYGKDGKPLIHTDGTGFISWDLALKCPNNIYQGTCIKACNIERLLVHTEAMEKYPESYWGEPPLLIQFRLFNNGRAVKGTLLVNNKLPDRTIRVRPSMIKVETDPRLANGFTKNSLEIVGTSNRPKKVHLSKNLIALLNYGGVPEEFFMGLLNNALEDAHGALSNSRAALRVALNHGDMDDNLVATMIACGIPLEESYLRHRLSFLMNEEKKSLKGGKIHVPESYYLMGTADPTGLLKSDEVCIILDNGHVSGKVLVYRNPGLHFGDIHILKAKHVDELGDFVGNTKYAIFFPCTGPRSLADEMSGGDFDGDMFFVSRNPKLLETFRQSEPWTSCSSIPLTVPAKKPSELSNEELEDELFKLFLTTRFKPSYTVGIAADSWLAIMDRLLTLGDDSADERAHMKESIFQLIDICYDALDAPKKSGMKIEVPEGLKAELFPHYMERKEEISYKSTSILGKIYDKVKSYEEMNQSIYDVWQHPCFAEEVLESSLQKWEKHYDEYRKEMFDALNNGNKEISDDASSEVIKKYKEILYEAAEFNLSKRREEDIFDEARAIYQVCYKHAKRKNGANYCSFAWKVAGSALCTLYVLKNERRRPMLCSPSALKGML